MQFKSTHTLLLLLFQVSFALAQKATVFREAAVVLKSTVLPAADSALTQLPITITAYRSLRSAGGSHDFFSEGDYWWPDPQNPQGPYIQRDGLTNPDNFVEHRNAMIRFSRIMGALASAYILTGEDKYARHAFVHARSWFIDTATRMHPHMLYAQAIQGRFTGRGIGIIDMIQFMEVSQALLKLESSRSAKPTEYKVFRNWFDDYLRWVTTHKYGIDEKNALNNHGTCWTMQVATFARFTKNQALLDTCRTRYRNIHLPDQMAAEGSFPKELVRTKPYGYSIFNLDAMVMICQILSDRQHDLWSFHSANNRTILNGIDFLFPYVQNKHLWPYKQDVMYWNDWPVAQPFLLFGANAFRRPEWLRTWKQLNHAPVVQEIIRNLPVRHPLIWF
jgi:hypothetical protein